MYEPSPNFSELRQGDIISNMYLPRFGISDVSFLHKMQADGSFQFSEQAIMSTSMQFAAVISQCCEFNENKRNSFSSAGLIGLGKRPFAGWKVFGLNLAEIVSWKAMAWTKHTPDSLKKANSIEPETGKFQIVNAYFLDPDGNHFKEMHAIDFTRVFSVRMKEKDRVLRNKILQLDDAHRIELQRKLAYFYARPAG